MILAEYTNNDNAINKISGETNVKVKKQDWGYGI